MFENLDLHWLKITSGYKSFSGSLCHFYRLRIKICISCCRIGQSSWWKTSWRLIWSQLLCATWFGLNIAGNANIPLLTGSEWGARILEYFDNPDLKYTKELKFQKHSDIATKIWRISNIFRYCSQYCYFGRSAWIFDWIWGNISAPVPTSDSLM